MKVGVEFELVVPVSIEGLDGDNYEPSYDNDESVRNQSNIMYFFSEVANNRLEQAINNDFMEWAYEHAIQDYIDENIDDINIQVKDELESDYDFDDAKERAAEELETDDLDSSEVIARAQEIQDEEINDMIENGDSTYRTIYDRVREEWEQDFNPDEDVFDRWLDYKGYSTMLDIYNAYPDYIDYWPNDDSYGGQDPDSALADLAEEIKDSLSIPVTYTTSYHGITKNSTEWVIEPDPSISHDSGESGLEIVSPPMPIKAGIDKIKEFVEWAKEYGCYTNSSTGLHMNISVPDFDPEKLDYVKLALFIGDEYILNQFGRQYNNFAKSAMKNIKQKISTIDSDKLSEYFSSIKKQAAPAVSKLIHKSETEKYTSINVKDSHVEFRSPGGDYLSKNIDDIINTLVRFAIGLKIATSPDLYKNEYYKKLYKLLSPAATTPVENKNFLLFAQYQTGIIDIATLKKNWVENTLARKPEVDKPPTVAAMKYARKATDNPDEPKQHDIMYDV
jgi:hypothetical protein